MGNKKKEAEPSPKNYTILHALVEALHEKDRRKEKQPILRRFRLRK